jgi:hypothetical protein
MPLDSPAASTVFAEKSKAFVVMAMWRRPAGKAQN